MLEIEGLTRVYGALRAVDDVSLSIGKGAFVGVIGRSGAGKSTLLRMINRLTAPSAGVIRWDGLDVTALTGAGLRDWRRRCAMIFQQFNLGHRLGVLTNVLCGRLHGMGSARMLLKLFTEAERRAALPVLAEAAQQRRLGGGEGEPAGQRRQRQAEGLGNPLPGERSLALGLGEGGNFPAAIKAVATWFPKRERALATSIFNAGTNIGALITPLVVPWVTLHWGWQWALEQRGWQALEEGSHPQGAFAVPEAAWPQPLSVRCNVLLWEGVAAPPHPWLPRGNTEAGHANLHSNWIAGDPPIATVLPWSFAGDPYEQVRLCLP